MDIALFADAGNVAPTFQDLNIDHTSGWRRPEIPRRAPTSRLDVAHGSEGGWSSSRPVIFPIGSAHPPRGGHSVRAIGSESCVLVLLTPDRSPRAGRCPARSRLCLRQSKPGGSGERLVGTASRLHDRDLCDGPWGARLKPDPTAVYTFVRRKQRGTNLASSSRISRAASGKSSSRHEAATTRKGPLKSCSHACFPRSAITSRLCTT